MIRINKNYREQKFFESISGSRKFNLFTGDNYPGEESVYPRVEDCVVVEIKTFFHLLTNDEIGQGICNLAATGYKVGLLLNFGRARLEYKRILPSKKLEKWQKKLSASYGNLKRRKMNLNSRSGCPEELICL
jgi:hypothetical protein